MSEEDMEFASDGTRKEDRWFVVDHMQCALLFVKRQSVSRVSRSTFTVLGLVKAVGWIMMRRMYRYRVPSVL